MAKASTADIERAYEALADTLSDAPAHQLVRPPETGLVMVRGRAGGDGGAFNLGEMTMTRCAVRLPSGELGVSNVAGRSARHAEIAAVCDALLQTGRYADAVARFVVEPLAAAQVKARGQRHMDAEKTRVDFLTLARGGD